MSARASKRPVAVTPALLRRWPLPQPSMDADKAERGVVMVAGGSSEIPGALLLAGVAQPQAPATFSPAWYWDFWRAERPWIRLRCGPSICTELRETGSSAESDRLDSLPENCPTTFQR